MRSTFKDFKKFIEENSDVLENEDFKELYNRAEAF